MRISVLSQGIETDEVLCLQAKGSESKREFLENLPNFEEFPCYIGAPPMERLDSWKEIAAFLGVTVRTAQKWEQERGLPVTRLPGARGPVSALTSEIEAWRQQGQKPIAPDAGPIASPITPVESARRPSWWYVAVAALIISAVAIAASAWLKVIRPKRQMATFRVEQKVLSAYDDSGVFLWSHTFDEPVVEKSPDDVRKRTWLGDLFGDGHREILFAYQEKSDTPKQSFLYCFTEDGRVLWKFSPGGNVKTASETFDPVYKVDQFLVVATGNGNKVIVSSTHYLYYPTQVVALSSYGEVLGEYWHSGHLGTMAMGRPGSRDAQTLYLGGINNELRAATLVLLDIASLKGTTASSHANANYQLQLPRAHERARIIFQRSCINKETESFDRVDAIFFAPEVVTVSTVEGLTRERSYASVMYEFDRELKLKSANPTDPFAVFHREMEAEGRLKHKLLPAEIALFQNIKYLPPSDEWQIPKTP